MLEKCLGWKGRHNFQGRYDEEALSPAAIEAYVASDANIFVSELNALKKRTYVHDICTACGAVIKRGESSII